MTRAMGAAALSAVLWTTLLVSACSGGGSSAADAGDSVGAAASSGTSTSTSTATVLDCTPGAVIATGVGSLSNNQWNAASAGAGPWKQCLQSRPGAGGVTEYGWSWSWPNRDGIYAYPEILVGGSPWSSTPSNDARFPRSIAATPSLQVDYELESQIAGKNNLALEFWLTDPAAPLLPSGLPPVKTELMIWSDESDGLIPAGETPVGTVDIAGITWTVYLHRDWGDASGGTGQRWTYIAYHAGRRSTTAHYDARKFLDDAVARGAISASDRISGVELGNELISGSGVSWVRHFTLAIQ